MNREMRRQAEKDGAIKGPTRVEKQETERGRQVALRERKVVNEQILPYMYKKEDELVPLSVKNICSFLNVVMTPLRWFIGHTPPLMMARMITQNQIAFIATPFPKLLMWVSLLLLAVNAIPMCIVGIIVDIIFLAPLSFVYTKLSTFGISIKVDDVPVPDNLERTVIVKRWGRAVERKTFKI